MYNVLLIGLGKIGRGLGEYATPWNSHLDAIRRAKWARTIFLYDPYIANLELQEGEHFLEDISTIVTYQGRDDTPLILIDAGPPNGRCARIHNIAKQVKCQLIIAEKPLDADLTGCFANFDDGVVDLDRLYINYPRRNFPSTEMVSSFLANLDQVRIDFRFNKGVKNTVSHFLDMLSLIRPANLDCEIIRQKNGVTMGEVTITQMADGDRLIFEFDVIGQNGVLKYLDCGREIIVEGRSYDFSHELEGRFRYSYDMIANIKNLANAKFEQKQLNKLLEIESALL